MSFLRDYLDHATGNEAPEMFHVWCAYGCLSATISRRVWMVLDDSAIYPNLYILLVGGAGNGKTWSLQKAKRIIAELDLPFSGSKETPEGMLRFMAGDPNRDKPIPPYGGADHKQFFAWPDGQKREVFPMNIIASEFVDFIKTDDIGWINTLNNIYDEDMYHYRTKGQGEDVLCGPYITLIGGLTTQISASMQKDQIINTGLARRTLFQFGERQWANPKARPVLSESQKLARVRAIEHLRKVKTVHGEFQWTEEVGLWYDKWYEENLRAVPKKPLSVQSWYASKSTQVMKLAMLTSLSERLDRVLEISHFEVALTYLGELERDLYRIFGGTGRNELAGVAVEIYNILAQMPEPVSHKKLMTLSWHKLPNRQSPVKEFKECMDHLLTESKVVSATVALSPETTEIIYATPETMKAFVKRHQSVVEQVVLPPVVPTALPQASPLLADPSSVPPVTPSQASPAEAQASAQSQLGTAIVPLPMRSL